MSASMTRRLFVCHAHAEIESTSEVVDALEQGLDFPPGSLWASSLPGYSVDLGKADESLRAALAKTGVVLALISASSAKDPQFNFELGASWAQEQRGLHVVLVLLSDADEVHVPVQLQSAPKVRIQDGVDWAEMIGDLSLRLGLVPRAAAVRAPVLAQTQLHTRGVGNDKILGRRDGYADDARSNTITTYPLPVFSDQHAPPSAAVVSAPPSAAQASDSALALALANDVEAAAKAAAASLEAPAVIAGSEPIPDDYFDDVLETTAASSRETHALHEPFDMELPAPTLTLSLEPPPADDDYDDYEVRTEGSADSPAGPAFSQAFSQEGAMASDVFARLPTCEDALEAGRAVSECVFNRADIDDFTQELDAPLGRLINGLGERWDDLRVLEDLDAWVAHTDQLLQTLPAEARHIEDWYKLGFELSTLHNLAGQHVLDGSDSDAERRWRAALERFLMRAERAEIGYENLGRVLGLLENLAGPRTERDLSNIGRSLAELRLYAAGADDVHTAA